MESQVFGVAIGRRLLFDARTLGLDELKVDCVRQMRHDRVLRLQQIGPRRVELFGPEVRAAFQTLPGSSFTVFGAPIPHNSALTSVGAELFLTPRWTLLAQFDGEFANGSQTYRGTVRCAIRGDAFSVGSARDASSWHVATFRYAAEFDRYRSQADVAGPSACSRQS